MSHFTQESISKELREINSRIPPLLKKHAYTEELLTPTIGRVMDEALLLASISDEKKAEVRRLKEEGYFGRKRITENPKYVKMIDNWMTREIKKAVAAGRLPTKAQLAELEITWKQEKENSLKV